MRRPLTLLMLSGLGDRAELARDGIAVVEHIPGVSSNFRIMSRSPIALATQIGRPPGRIEHALGLVTAARFDQHHLAIEAFGRTTDLTALNREIVRLRTSI